MTLVEKSSLPGELRRRLDEWRRRASGRASTPGASLPRVPLIGREREVETLRALVDRVEGGRGSTVFLRGPRGVGKSRMGQEIADYVQEREWIILHGRAYPAEHLVPFAPFSNAFLPILRDLDTADLEELAPGGVEALWSLLRVLESEPPQTGGRLAGPAERQATLFWHLTGMLAQLAAYQPVLLILEDLDFADRSSIELFHFVARHCTDQRILVIGQYTGWEPRRRQSLISIEQSLKAMGAGTVLDLQPLTEEETKAFVQAASELADEDVDRVSDLAFHWTRGNTFFLQCTLPALVEGDLRTAGDGGTARSGVEISDLPRSVFDAVLSRVAGLSTNALELARLVAVLGTRTRHELLEDLSDLGGELLSGGLDELIRHEILYESEKGWTPGYDFQHPLIRETLRAELSASSRGQLHARVAAWLENYYQGVVEEHAEELAYHFRHGNLEESAKAVHYLGVAGKRALARQANEEAVDYFQEALDRLEAAPAEGELDESRRQAALSAMIAGLARAKRRVGDIQTSVALWRRAVAMDESTGGLARNYREIGLTYLAGGDLEQALEAFERGLGAAKAAADVPLMIRIELARSLCYQSAGRGDEARRVAENALTLAHELGNPDLLGRTHAALVRLHIWGGQLELVRHHAEMALKLARQAGDKDVEFWCHWAVAAMEGLFGNTEQMASRIAEAKKLSTELGSPFLQLETAELSIELAYARGEWDEGVEIGERAVETARSLSQHTVLPRLLVWLALLRLGRSELDVAEELTREAWDVSGADRALMNPEYVDVHSVVPAHIGRAAYHLTRGDWSEAVRIAEAGLAIADRTGYVVWAIHRLLPIIAEASIHARDLERAREVGRRMRTDAETFGHPLGLAWADACDAIITWLEGDAETGAVALRRGAESLESIPLVYEAAKLRRQLAGRLAEKGDHDGAVAELRKVHEVFLRLGAQFELEKARGQFGEVGVEPPDLPVP